MQAQDNRETSLQKVWRAFCRVIVRIFYRRREGIGLERIPTEGPVLLCANHPNTVVDAIVIQAFCPRLIHPLARSGLFDYRLARPWLNLMQAVPVYRRHDLGVDTDRNVQSFKRCYELLARDEVLLIFPEGQSHADPHLHVIKTGAARIARGSIDTTGTVPTVLPVGVNFSERGRFRSSVLLVVGDTIDLTPLTGEEPTETVRRLTALIESGLDEVTLSAESVDELSLSRRLERFFALRRGRYRRGSLEQRFRALKKIMNSQRLLRRSEPQRVAELSERLHGFESLCERLGVRDYQLTVHYSPWVIARFVLRSLVILFLVLPLGLWGAANSAIPLIFTQRLVKRVAKGPHEYDFTRIAAALSIFAVAWVVQAAIVGWFLGAVVAAAYLLSLPPTFAAALLVYREKDRIIENIDGFILFIRKRELRDYLLTRRRELEKELARMARLLKRDGRLSVPGIDVNRSEPKGG